MSLERRWSDILDSLKAQGRFRSFALPKGIDLTSNDYLGYGNGRVPQGVTLTHRPSPESLPRTGMSSRLLRGHHAVWEEVESALARWHGAESVLMMTSGYAANEGLISTLFEPADWVASDELNHACIITTSKRA
jgi:8-amino-7-oxononanoate synthase